MLFRKLSESNLRVIHKSVRYSGVFLLAVFSTHGLTQEQTDAEDSLTAPRFNFSASMGYSSLDSEKTSSEGLGDAAFGVNLIGTYQISDYLIGNAGIGFLTIEDESEFEEQVVVSDIFGTDVDTLESSASALPVFAEMVYQSPRRAVSGIRFRAGVGFNHLIFAKREIADCSNCREDDLDIHGGPYATASLLHYTRKNRKFGLTIRQYLSGDLSNTVSIFYEFSRYN